MLSREDVLSLLDQLSAEAERLRALLAQERAVVPLVVAQVAVEVEKLTARLAKQTQKVADATR
jgi:hypothetical protein